MQQRYYKKVKLKYNILKDVMIFVNNLAEVVHSMVDRFLGAANKNIGDAFLLVWKIK